MTNPTALLPALLCLPVLLLALAGCARAPQPSPHGAVLATSPALAARAAQGRPASVPAPPAPTPAVVPIGPEGLEGRYAGLLRLAPNQRRCAPPGLPAAMTVAGGRAAFSTGRGSVVEGTIRADGSISFDGPTAVHGSFVAPRFIGHAERGACSYLVELARRGGTATARARPGATPAEAPTAIPAAAPAGAAGMAEREGPVRPPGPPPG